uniref:Secreted protein n=1 Tax=Oryza glumipatula TaxID=40148 RepID=A0A0D9YZH7_9ORYZ
MAPQARWLILCTLQSALRLVMHPLIMHPRINQCKFDREFWVGPCVDLPVVSTPQREDHKSREKALASHAQIAADHHALASFALQIADLQPVFLSFCMDKELMEGTFGNLLRQKPSGNWQKSNPPPTVEYYSRNPHQNSHHDHEQHGVLKYLDLNNLCLVIRAPLFLLPDLLLRLCIVALPLCLG